MSMASSTGSGFCGGVADRTGSGTVAVAVAVAVAESESGSEAGPEPAAGPTISPDAVRCTPRMPGTRTTSAHGTDSTIAAATRVEVKPMEAPSGPATANPTGMMTSETSQS